MMKKLDPLKLEELVSRRAGDDIAAGRILCCSVLVKQEGKTLLEKQYGSADFQGAALDASRLFRIASMTKPVTAVAVMMLFDMGLIDLDVPVEKYLPEFASLRLGRVDENGDPLWTRPLEHKPTVRNLLNHTSLLDLGETFKRQERRMTPSDLASLERSVDFYSRLVLETEPGTRHSYSGTVAFDVLAVLISRLTGIPYDRFVRERITDPLGMTDTVFVPSADQLSRLVEMHDLTDKGAVPGAVHPGCVFEKIPWSHPLAGAGLISSVRDYSRFAEMLLDGEYGGRRYLSPRALRLMRTPEYPHLTGTTNRWGLGVRVIDNEEKILPVGCFGWSGAYGTHFWVDPENRVTAVYMKNSHYDCGGGAVTGKHFEADVTAGFTD